MPNGYQTTGHHAQPETNIWDIRVPAAGLSGVSPDRPNTSAMVEPVLHPRKHEQKGKEPIVDAQTGHILNDDLPDGAYTQTRRFRVEKEFLEALMLQLFLAHVSYGVAPMYDEPQKVRQDRPNPGAFPIDHADHVSRAIDIPITKIMVLPDEGQWDVLKRLSVLETARKSPASLSVAEKILAYLESGLSIHEAI